MAGLLGLVVIAAAAALGWHHWIRREPKFSSAQALLDSELQRYLRRNPQASLVFSAQQRGITTISDSGGPQAAVPAEQWIFQIGSVTKLFTACLLLRLHQQQRIDMHSTLQQSLDNTVGMHPALMDITLFELATHRSGLPRVPASMMKTLKQRSKGEPLMHNPYAHFQLDDLLQWLARGDGRRSPGSFKYSNLGAGLLGHALEQHCNESLESLLQREICKPLGLDSTSFERATLAQEACVQGLDNAGTPTPDWQFPILAAAGGLYSCAADLQRFLQAFVDESQPLHSELIAMLEPHTDGKTALGWMLPTPLNRLLGQAAIRWHDGMVGGFSACVMLDLNSGTTLITLRNQPLDSYWMTTILLRKLLRLTPD